MRATEDVKRGLLAAASDPRHALAKQLRADGFTLSEVAARFGVGVSTIVRWTDPAKAQRDREASAAAKRKRTGTCVDCGGPTTYDGRGGTSTRCQSCRKVLETSELYRLGQTKWTRPVLIARIQEWAETYGRPPGIADWNPWMARHELHDTERAERFEMANGYWPNFSSVVQRFGSWNAGIAAAGFQPRPAHSPRQTNCKRGHELTEANRAPSGFDRRTGKRSTKCRACANERQRRYARERKERA